jgi:hypothetical protein
MEELHRENARFFFLVISKTAGFTQSFLKRMKRRDYVTVYESSHDKQVVEAYENLYKEKLISFELTKPSEQVFKALLSSEQAALLVQWGIKKGLFSRMAECHTVSSRIQDYPQELGSNGVELFWNYVSEHYLTNHTSY